MQVLLVEDEVAISEMLQKILSREGFTVAVAGDVPTGLALSRSLRPELVVSDVMLPGGNGIDLCGQIARELPGCSFVLMSGSTAFKDFVDLAMKSGLTGPVIQKPFTLSAFRSAVRAASGVHGNPESPAREKAS